MTLPNATAADLAKGSNFFNLSKRRDEARTGEWPASEHRFACIAGVVDEKTSDEDAKIPGGPKRVAVRAFAITGQPSPPELRDGFDLIEFREERLLAEPIQNYGGLSGGSLWSLHLEPSDTLDGFKFQNIGRIMGVVFWQDEPSNGSRSLWCNGFDSVYNVLVPEVASWLKDTTI